MEIVSLPSDGRTPGLSPQGSYAIGVLAELLGKDMTVTATELDIAHSNTWFMCTACQDIPHRAYYVGWRSWVRKLGKLLPT